MPETERVRDQFGDEYHSLKQIVISDAESFHAGGAIFAHWSKAAHPHELTRRDFKLGVQLMVR
jgi:hypothetical protein